MLASFCNSHKIKTSYKHRSKKWLLTMDQRPLGPQDRGSWGQNAQESPRTKHLRTRWSHGWFLYCSTALCSLEFKTGFERALALRDYIGHHWSIFWNWSKLNEIQCWSRSEDLLLRISDLQDPKPISHWRSVPTADSWWGPFCCKPTERLHRFICRWLWQMATIQQREVVDCWITLKYLCNLYPGHRVS